MTYVSIVITGNPGVGKHTIAGKLTKKLGKPILDLNKIAIEKKICEKNGSTLDVDVIKLARIMKKTIKSDSIIVGHLAPYVLTKSQVKSVIVLRKSPYKLIPIYKKRKYSQKKTIQNIGSEILGIIAYDCVSKFGKNKVSEINVTDLSSNQIINKIGLIFKQRFKSDKVDWLDMISKKGDLVKFFPNEK